MGMSVAVIGLGAMGSPIAGRLVETGHAVIGFDQREETLGALVKQGVRRAHRPADCCAADVVLIVVATADQLRDVVLGEHGVLAGVRPGRSPLLVVMSTVSAKTVRQLGRAAREYGVSLVDAPVSGGAIRAREGTLTIMLGATESDAARAKPALDSLSKDLFHCGPVGAGETVKIVNNIICAANVFVTAEAYRLATEAGLTLSEITPILEVSTGRNFLSVSADYVAEHFSSLTESRALFDATLAIMCKDMGLAAELVADSGGAYPVIDGLRSILDSLGAESYENWRQIGVAPRR